MAARDSKGAIRAVVAGPEDDRVNEVRQLSLVGDEEEKELEEDEDTKAPEGGIPAGHTGFS